LATAPTSLVYSLCGGNGYSRTIRPVRDDCVVAAVVVDDGLVGCALTIRAQHKPTIIAHTHRIGIRL